METDIPAIQMHHYVMENGEIGFSKKEMMTALGIGFDEDEWRRWIQLQSRAISPEFYYSTARRKWFLS